MASPTSAQFGVAVHVLTLLSADPEPVSSAALADSAGASPVHVRRVLGGLAKAGLVLSRPGPGGGWRLARPPAAITLADVRAAVTGPRVLGVHEAAIACTVGRRIQAELEAIERDAVARVDAGLAQTTIADVVDHAAVDAGWRPAA